jgi:hypothetical protein
MLLEASIHVPSMSDLDNQNEKALPFNPVDNPIIAHP